MARIGKHGAQGIDLEVYFTRYPSMCMTIGSRAQSMKYLSPAFVHDWRIGLQIALARLLHKKIFDCLTVSTLEPRVTLAPMISLQVQRPEWTHRSRDSVCCCEDQIVSNE